MVAVPKRNRRRFWETFRFWKRFQHLWFHHSPYDEQTQDFFIFLRFFRCFIKLLRCFFVHFLRKTACISPAKSPSPFPIKKRRQIFSVVFSASHLFSAVCLFLNAAIPASSKAIAATNAEGEAGSPVFGISPVCVVCTSFSERGSAVCTAVPGTASGLCGESAPGFDPGP